jgi:hypothetical protein
MKVGERLAVHVKGTSVSGASALEMGRPRDKAGFPEPSAAI